MKVLLDPQGLPRAESAGKRQESTKSIEKMVGRVGIEPTTNGLKERYFNFYYYY